MPVWRNAFSSSYDHLHLEAHLSFTKPTQHVPSSVLPFVSPRKRARPFNAQIWRKMEERESGRGTSGRLHARSFLVIFMGRAHLHCHSALPRCSEGVRRPRPDPPAPTSSSFSIRHAALHLCLGSHQSGKKLNICPFAFRMV